MSRERLDKVLANMGYGTRKEVKAITKSGQVTVNSNIIKDSSTHVNPYEDEIIINGEKVNYREFIYIMMHKPPGVISATEDKHTETVIDILEYEDAVFKPAPVGRLDKDTEGLLLITNDGELNHKLLSPKNHVPKKYYADIEGEVTESDIAEFSKGIVLDDGYHTMPAELTILESGEESKIEVVIYEGKYHQVKRMFEAVGKKVVYLKRLEMGPLVLDEDLELGQYRELTDEEVESLFNYTK
ncbi:MAG: pseudouridine synthase [Clostridium sp.]